jgi:cytochrome c oxidase cbb3-type subunit I
MKGELKDNGSRSLMNEKPITALFAYPTVVSFCLTSAFWMLIATFMGVLLATALIAPDLTEGIGWLTFGRVRPVHVNLVLFGFVTPGLLSAAFYYIPKLSRADLYSEKLGVLTACIWNITMAGAVVTLLSGKPRQENMRN